MNQLDQEGRTPADLPRGVSPEIAANNEDVQTIIQPRLQMLMEIANTFLDTIIASLEMVPYGIRWICKQIRSLLRVSCDWLTYEWLLVVPAESFSHRS
jgi:Ras GTPase-activating-like protein IQGAP2/3